MTCLRLIAVALVVLSTTQKVSAFEDIALPFDAEETYREMRDGLSHIIPIAPFKNDSLPSLWVNGKNERTVFKINDAAPSFEIARIFRDQLREQGYSELFYCHDQVCGGFDFYYELDRAPASALYIDLRNFHFVVAEKQGDSDKYISLLISRSETAGFVQIDIVSGVSEPNSITTLKPLDIKEQFGKWGRVLLDKLDFESGSPDLGENNYPQLQALADFLNSNPNARILLVGHTDSMGSHEANLELSKKRAMSVAKHLIEIHQVDPKQISSEGIGFFAPLTTNNTPEGRQINRRVEAVLLADE